ncbi:hypothetical protein [Erythrobacter sp. SD-21]|uniref:hypothetical protein n=1 Tax=Erythrobacter sp. SD-21 TaxID=161528 RepID=UPI000153EF80|nr:hypothetical protein [Erythrobacter sp. SD-21]EDL49230.1 hypothetical protein ED21_21159 [Erythrobacter sp. SD-21]
MKFTPQMLGAVAVVAIAGAVSGATIGDSPVLKRGHTDTLPEAQLVAASNEAVRTSQRPPDHYPLETPKGTIEVGELALHGRLRDRGGDMWWERSEDDALRMSAEYDFYATASPERIEHERRLLAFQEGAREDAEYAYREERAVQAVPGRMTRAEAPMALAEPVKVAAQVQPAQPSASETSVGSSKTVNVSAALARRN